MGLYQKMGICSKLMKSRNFYLIIPSLHPFRHQILLECLVKDSKLLATLQKHFLISLYLSRMVGPFQEAELSTGLCQYSPLLDPFEVCIPPCCCLLVPTPHSLNTWALIQFSSPLQLLPSSQRILLSTHTTHLSFQVSGSWLVLFSSAEIDTFYSFKSHILNYFRLCTTTQLCHCSMKAARELWAELCSKTTLFTKIDGLDLACGLPGHTLDSLQRNILSCVSSGYLHIKLVS